MVPPCCGVSGSNVEPNILFGILGDSECRAYLMVGATKINKHKVPRLTPRLVLQLGVKHGQHFFTRHTFGLRISGGRVGGVPRRC